MRAQRLAAALLVFFGVAGASFAQTLTDEELLKLFEAQRDSFAAAKQSGTGKTRGLTLVTVDTVKVTTLAPDQPSPADDMKSPTLPGTDAQKSASGGPVPLAEPLQDQAAILDAEVPDAPLGAKPEVSTDTGLLAEALPDTPVPPLTPVDSNTVAVLVPAEIAPSAPETQPVVFGSLAPDLQINLNIRFPFDSATLTPDQEPVLTQMCKVMKMSDINLFRIIGHTDASGTAEYNQTLSQLRAEEVQRYLVTDCGIDPARLQALGLGEQFLTNQKDPKAAENRRVEFQALS